MKIREGDTLRILHLSQELKAKALNSTGKGDLGILVELFRLNGEREVMYVPFGIVGDGSGDDERAVGAEPGQSRVLDSMAGPLLLGLADDADVPQGEADGDGDHGSGKALLETPGGKRDQNKGEER